jgi:hypothetical protein
MVDVAGGRGHDLKKFRQSSLMRLVVLSLKICLRSWNLSAGIECQPIDLFEPQTIKGDTTLVPADIMLSQA